jgi:hypothetical protein
MRRGVRCGYAWTRREVFYSCFIHVRDGQTRNVGWLARAADELEVMNADRE